MRFLDFSSWHGVMTTVLGFALFMLMGMGMRVLMMMTVQQRQQRMNRQINERLRTLMAAYKVLGGSFTGMLQVDPRSRRKYLSDVAGTGHAPVEGEPVPQDEAGTIISGATVVSEQVTVQTSELVPGGSGALPPFVIERRIQMRNAVEAALSDVLLLGTEDHVRLASMAASQLAAGHPIQTAELVASLRDYIRKALGLEAIPAGIAIPAQGPTRPSAPGNAGGRGGRPEGDRQREGGQGGAAGGGDSGMAGGMGMGMGAGMGRRTSSDDI